MQHCECKIRYRTLEGTLSIEALKRKLHSLKFQRPKQWSSWGSAPKAGGVATSPRTWESEGQLFILHRYKGTDGVDRDGEHFYPREGWGSTELRLGACSLGQNVPAGARALGKGFPSLGPGLSNFTTTLNIVSGIFSLKTSGMRWGYF